MKLIAHRSILVLVVAVSCIVMPRDAAAWRGSYVDCTTCQTHFRNGNHDGDLTVDIAGIHHEEVQVFFRHNFFSDNFKYHVDLHCTGEVAFSFINDQYATFSLRYDDQYCKNRFTLYGIPQALGQKLVKITNDPKEQSQRPGTFFVATDDGYPVRVEWVSSQVAKITHGPSHSKTIILRFLPQNEGEWISLDGTKVTRN